MTEVIQEMTWSATSRDVPNSEANINKPVADAHTDLAIYPVSFHLESYFNAMVL